MNRIVLSLALFAIAVFASAIAMVGAPRTASSGVPSSEVAKKWWVQTHGRYVVGNLEFKQDSAIAGAFTVTGTLMVRMPKDVAEKERCRPVELFTVTTAENEPVAFTARGQLRGVLNLAGADGSECQGTLKILRGKDRVALRSDVVKNVPVETTVRRLTLRGLLTIGETPIRGRQVRLRGVDVTASRSPTAKARWQGESNEARVRGSRVASNKFGVHLMAHPTLGFPFLDLNASGTVRLDREAPESLVLTGIVAVARNRRGLVRISAAASEDLGVGWGRSQHAIASPLATEALGPLVSFHTLLTPEDGRPHNVIITGQLDPLTP